VSEALRPVLAGGPATRVDEILARLRAIAATLPPRDGVRAFTVLYIAVTEAVAVEVEHARFEDTAFVRRLDVVFAELYFAALRAAYADAAAVPKAWAPLFEARGRRGVLALQFALAGMNAHINRDLPLALVATCEERGVDLRAGSPRHRDFRRIDPLLARVEERVKTLLLTDDLSDLDLALGDVDDVVAMWKVERARAAAWTQAEALLALRGLPRLRRELLETQDRLVGLAGRGLLRPL
jgi:hypothetical protein